MEEKRWLTPPGLYKEYNFSEDWQAKARMSKSKSGLPFCKIGRFILYDRYEIDQWIEKHQIRGDRNG